jgi:hypothetical protein
LKREKSLFIAGNLTSSSVWHSHHTAYTVSDVVTPEGKQCMIIYLAVVILKSRLRLLSRLSTTRFIVQIRICLKIMNISASYMLTLRCNITWGTVTYMGSLPASKSGSKNCIGPIKSRQLYKEVSERRPKEMPLQLTARENKRPGFKMCVALRKYSVFQLTSRIIIWH